MTGQQQLAIYRTRTVVETERTWLDATEPDFPAVLKPLFEMVNDPPYDWLPVELEGLTPEQDEALQEYLQDRDWKNVDSDGQGDTTYSVSS